MSKNVFSGKFDPLIQEQLGQTLVKAGFFLTEVQHAFWQAHKDRIFITFFRSGKVVIQAQNAIEYAQRFLLPLKSDQSIPGLESMKSLNQWIGTDESGKGDFFGPLVVAALLVTKKTELQLWLHGVQDSKDISDHKIIQLAGLIKKSFAHSVVSFPPHKYNTLYENYFNLNKLLSSAHAQAIKNLIDKTNCRTVITDKFGDEKLIQDELQDTLHLTLIQKHQAEANLAVAGASILAREKFLDGLEKLSDKYQINFPRGASAEVVEVAKKFVKKYGQAELKNVAKSHFKTMKQLL